MGRGDGSGHGSYSGRGCKGQKSRSGANIPPRFEGGQLPLVKRLPRKRGFTNIWRTRYVVVNVGELNLFESGAEVTADKLQEAGLIGSLRMPLKILGEGELHHPLIVKAAKFSASAREKIKAAEGRVEEVRHATKAR